MNSDQTKRSVIIGDVHGCLDELDALIEKVGYQPQSDSLYFLGDIINRGPCSKAAFFRILELQGQSILGNHEWHILNAVRNGTESKMLSRLKAAFDDDFSVFIKEIQNWPLYIETDDFILVHAGLQPGLHPRDTDPEILTAIRTWDGQGKVLFEPDHPPWFDLYEGSKLVVFGHWAALEGVVRDNVIGLDTGCVYGKKLSALLLPGREVVQVNAKKIYRRIK